VSESSGYVEVEGGLADLGLESSDIPEVNAQTGVGYHKGFLVDAKFLAHPEKGRQLVLTYKVHQEGSKWNGSTKSEFIDANRSDPVDKKKWLRFRLENLGIPRESQGALNIKDLKGTPVYFRIREKAGYLNIVEVSLDTDGEFDASMGVEATATSGAHSRPAVVSATEVDY
jgi:hypothetical protein